VTLCRKKTNMPTRYLYFLTSFVLACEIFSTFSPVRSLNPPIWPANWTADWSFVLDSNKEVIQKGGWWYAYGNPAGHLLREDNTLGCNLTEANLPCSVIFRDKNIYAVAYNGGEQEQCCLCARHVPPTPPTWLEEAVFNRTGSCNYFPDEMCSIWIRNLSAVGHVQTYYQSLSTNLPVAIDGGGAAIVWQNVTVQPTTARLFDIPKGCTSGCGSDTTLTFSHPFLGSGFAQFPCTVN